MDGAPLDNIAEQQTIYNRRCGREVSGKLFDGKIGVALDPIVECPSRVKTSNAQN